LKRYKYRALESHRLLAEQMASYNANATFCVFLFFLYIFHVQGGEGSKPGACSSGPYLFDDSCKVVSQGIGSSMNRMKYIIVMSRLYNLPIIPNPMCFTSSEHGTDLLAYFGWSYALDCTAEDVKRATSLSSVGSAIPNDRLLKVEITTWTDGTDHNCQNKQLDKVCRALSTGKDTKTMTKSFANDFPFCSKNNLFVQMETQLPSLPSGLRNVVLVSGQRYLMEGYICTREFIRERWAAYRPDEVNATIASLKKAPIHIAFHLRHGDVATKDLNYIDQAKEIRTIPMQQGIDVLKALLGPKSVLHKATTKITLFSEGNSTEFKDFMAAFPSATLRLGTASTITEDIDLMARADVLLASPSSFTSLISALNTDGIILVDKWNPEKFEGISNVVKQADLMRKNLDTFNVMFCRQKMYATRERNNLCGVPDEEKDTKSTDATILKSEDPVNHDHYHHQHVQPLYLEIQHLRRTLSDTGSKFRTALGSSFTRDAIHKELEFSHNLQGLFENFTATFDATCYIRPGISTERKHLTVCTESGVNSPNLSKVRFSYFLRAVARDIVSRGFQIPTHIVRGAKVMRGVRMRENLQEAGIRDKYVTWESRFVAGSIADDDKAKNFRTGNPAYVDCEPILGTKACRRGYKFSDSEMSVALKHIAIIRSIADAARRQSSKEGDRAREGKHFAQRYSLILEDDQFLPKTILRQIVEVLLQTPEDLGLVMLDDSFFFDPTFDPPESTVDFPFPVSYATNRTRTVGAYLISHSAALKLMDGGHFHPLVTPVDHQLNWALKKDQILTHWVFPPVTCAGSQGLETGIKSSTGGKVMDPGDRENCRTCCNRFYNTTTMDEIFALGVKN
jgi:hypothetical protein